MRRRCRVSCLGRMRERLARAKADAVAAAGCFVLAADTVVAAGRRILPKAETEAEARACLTLLSGRRHRVLTAVVLRAPDGRRAERLVESVVGLGAADPRAVAGLPGRRRVAGQGRAVTPSRGPLPRSFASCPAATPTWSACRCSRRRSCCAASAGPCRDRDHPRRLRAGPGPGRGCAGDIDRLRDLAARLAGWRRRPAPRPGHRPRPGDGAAPSWRWTVPRRLPARHRGRGRRDRGQHPWRADHPRGAGRQGAAAGRGARRRGPGLDRQWAACADPPWPGAHWCASPALYPDAPVRLDDAGLAATLRPLLGARLTVVRSAFDAALEGRIEALAEPVVDLPGARGWRSTRHRR